jgi:putative transposase
MRTKFGEAEIFAILQEHESGLKPADLARKHEITRGTVYRWIAKYRNLDISELKELRTLESENKQLRALLIRSILENAALTEHLSDYYSADHG